MIQLCNVVKKISPDGTEILKNISLKIGDNEIVGIIGPSGAGKSTLLKTLGLIITADSGKYVYMDKDIYKADFREREAIRKCMSFIFQSSNLMDDHTIEENISLPLRIKGYKKERIKNKTDEIVCLLGLQHIRSTRAINVSGGEKQRCAIGMALAADSKIILADEPTSMLDSTGGEYIMDMLLNLKKYNKTVVIVSHDIADRSQFDSIFYLKDGCIEDEYHKN